MPAKETVRTRKLSAEDLRNRMVDEIRANGGNMSEDDLASLLVKAEKKASPTQFNDALKSLIKEKRVYRSGNGKLFVKAAPVKQYVGVVQGHRDGYGFLICNEDVPDLFIPEEEMGKVLPGDTVEAVASGVDYRGRKIARITALLSRKMHTIVGRLSLSVSARKKVSACVIPEDNRVARVIHVDVAQTTPDQNNKIVVVEPDEKGLLPEKVHGKIIEVLGNIDDPGMEIEIAVRKFDLPHEFSAENKAEIAKFSDHVTKADLRGRVDLRDVPFVTIDGADAKDFDDAVFCLPIEDKKGWYRLLVAIADVSHYVKPGSAIDKDAQLRTTSVYFPRKVIPMLPEELSNGLCSLNPHVDRCTMVCDAVIDSKGEVTAYQFYPAVIRSAARLIYDDVWEAFKDPSSPAAKTMEHVLGNVQDLYDLFKILLGSRTLRGAMDFETVETYIVADDQGKIEKILPRERNDAHRLIEEMMLVANTCAADFLLKNNAPCLYRVHEPPSEDRLEKARVALKAFGLVLGGGDDPTPADYCKVIEQIKDRPDRSVIQLVLLRSMQQALYSPHNCGHFGLAYPAYTHFTSPIRRYPDLLVHRAIRGVLKGRKYAPKILISADEVDVPIQMREMIEKNEEGQKKHPSLEKWEKLGLLCSAYERRADEASFDVMAWLKTYYMQQHIGSEYAGVITGVSPFGLYITLEDLYVEGAVHISQLGAEYFEYDEERNELVGSDTGRKFKIGMPVRIRVSGADLDARRIEFSLVSSARSLKSRSKSSRSRRKNA